MDRVTDIAMTQLIEIMIDCMIDSDKDRYEERILNCFERASLLNKLTRSRG